MNFRPQLSASVFHFSFIFRYFTGVAKKFPLRMFMGQPSYKCLEYQRQGIFSVLVIPDLCFRFKRYLQTTHFYERSFVSSPKNINMVMAILLALQVLGIISEKCTKKGRPKKEYLC
jgi:hypothetical protein